MHISFDNLGELDEFLKWVANGTAPLLPVLAPQATLAAELLRGEWADKIAADEAETPEQALRTAHIDVAEVRAEMAAEPQKRKRRTKAEMQADAERETGLQQPGALPEGQGTEPGSSTPETAGNAAVQAALAGDAVGAAAALANVPLGDSPFAIRSADQVRADVLANEPVQPAGTLPPVAKPQGPEETRAWIEMTAVGKFNAITPVDHMNLAKNFIAAKGMSGYNESFGLVGLSNNIMGFTQEQRALHAAALDFLDWA
jgi:hypothetical protein